MLIRSFVAIVPVAVLAGVAAALAWEAQGSIAGRDWLGYAVLAALLVPAVAAGRPRRPAAPALAGLVALLLLAVWLGLSSLWSPLPTLAREEALLAALYAVVLAVPLLALRSGGDRVAALWALVLALAGSAVAVGLVLLLAPEPSMFKTGRLFYPVTYTNGMGAFFLVGFWPAAALACRRATPVALRAVALGGAAALLAGWLVTQSKGGLAGLAASALVLLALSPARLRLAVAAILAAVPVAAAYGPLTGTFRADDAEFAAAARSAGAAILVVAAVAAAAGAAYAFGDRRLELSEPRRRLAGRAALTAVVLAAAAGVAAFAAAVDDPASWAGDRWAEFKTLPEDESGSSHLVTLGSSRYDFWRVAVEEAADHPVAGIGARGWGAAYLREGQTRELPARAHSLFLEVLAENGVVGLLLLLAALGAPLWLVARRAATVPAAAALGGGVYWIAHASVDWTWSLPAAGVPFFLLLGIGASGGGRPLSGRAALVAGGGAAALALLVFTPAWLSERLAFQALQAGSPAAARDELRWSKRLNPLSVTPYVVEGELAPSPAAAIRPLEEAREREPRSVGVRYRLGLAYLEAGRRADAREELRAALELWPRSEPIAQALERAE